MARSELGAYLSERRAQLDPDEVNLPSTGPRRVPGLRREEVALLAGVSVDYYIRLEQGRERTPSAQVVDALAVALRLGEDGRQHLFRLAGLSPRDRVAAVPDRVDPSLLELMSAWPNNPAIVYNRAYDVLASNAIADALFHDWTHSRNLMHIVFTERQRGPSTGIGTTPPAIRSPASASATARRPTTRGSSRCSRNCSAKAPLSQSFGTATTRAARRWSASASSTATSDR